MNIGCLFRFRNNDQFSLVCWLGWCCVSPVWGNLIGIALCLAQKYLGLISLDPSSYYLDTVPINLNVGHILLLNLGTMVVTFLFLLIPSMIISRISPDKSIKFN